MNLLSWSTIFFLGAIVGPALLLISGISPRPTSQPSTQPTRQPSIKPNFRPSHQPTTQPSIHTCEPTGRPSRQPVNLPSSNPSHRTTFTPSFKATSEPTASESVDDAVSRVGLGFGFSWISMMLITLFSSYFSGQRLVKKLAAEDYKYLASKFYARQDTSISDKIQQVSKSPSKLSSRSRTGENFNTGNGINVSNNRVVKRKTVLKSNSIDPKVLAKVATKGYLDALFYGSISIDENVKFFSILAEEACQHHSYLSLVLIPEVGKRRWIKCLRLATGLSIAAALTFVFYGVHAPSNDNTCMQRSTKSDCLSTISSFDYTKTKCMWNSPTSDSSEGFCSFYCAKEEYYDYRAFVIIVMCIAVVMGPIYFLLDLICQKVLLAPMIPTDDAEEISREILYLDDIANTPAVVTQQWDSLCAQLISYRSLIQKQDEHGASLQSFDLQWGILPADPPNAVQFLVMDSIKNDMTSSRINSLKLRRYLEASGDDRCVGNELLVSFIIDLLGSHSIPARILKNKINSNRGNNAQRVTYWSKVFASTFLLLLNIAMMLVAVFEARGKVMAWLNAALVAVVCFATIDFIFLEGSKLLWSHVVIPLFIKPYLLHAASIIYDIVGQLCEESSLDKRKSVFNVCNYLFASTKLAKRFPDIFESSIILHYNTSYPGLNGHHWRNAHSELYKIMNSRAKSSVTPTVAMNLDSTEFSVDLTASIISHKTMSISMLSISSDRKKLAQQSTVIAVRHFFIDLASRMNVECQQMIVHVAQPLFILGFIYLVYFLMSSTAYGLYIIFALLMFLAGFGVIYWLSSQARRNGINSKLSGSQTLTQPESPLTQEDILQVSESILTRVIPIDSSAGDHMSTPGNKINCDITFKMINSKDPYDERSRANHLQRNSNLSLSQQKSKSSKSLGREFRSLQMQDQFARNKLSSEDAIPNAMSNLMQSPIDHHTPIQVASGQGNFKLPKDINFDDGDYDDEIEYESSYNIDVDLRSVSTSGDEQLSIETLNDLPDHTEKLKAVRTVDPNDTKKPDGLQKNPSYKNQSQAESKTSSKEYDCSRSSTWIQDIIEFDDAK